MKSWKEHRAIVKSWRGKRACFVASDTRLCEYDGVERGWGSTATPETFKAKQYFTTILISNTTITLFHFTSKNSRYLAKIFIIKRNNSQLNDLANVLLPKFICTHVSLLPFFGIHLPRTIDNAGFSETVETIVAKNILNSAFVSETSTESERIGTFDALWSNYRWNLKHLESFRICIYGRKFEAIATWFKVLKLSKVSISLDSLSYLDL